MMRIVFSTDFPFRFDSEERIHVRLPYALAQEKPEWEVHALYWKLSSDDTNKLQTKPPNLTIHIVSETSLAPMPVEEGDVLVIMHAIPTHSLFFQNIADKLQEISKHFKKICYIALDCWSGWHGKDTVQNILTGKTYSVNELEYHICGLSDYIFSVSPILCVWLSKRYDLEKPVFWLPNAADLEFWKPSKPWTVTDKMLAVLIGTLRTQGGDFDKELRAVARKFPNITFIQLGKVVLMPEIPPQSFHDNLYFLCYDEMKPNRWKAKELLKHATFCLCGGTEPTVFNYFGDPTKWYVYHASARPILSLNTPHHSLFPQIYPYTVCHNDLAEGIEKMLKWIEKNAPSELSINPKHDWKERAREFARVIEGGDSTYGLAYKGTWETKWNP